jgi:hypothetical protein
VNSSDCRTIVRSHGRVRAGNVEQWLGICSAGWRDGWIRNQRWFWLCPVCLASEPWSRGWGHSPGRLKGGGEPEPWALSCVLLRWLNTSPQLCWETLSANSSPQTEVVWGLLSTYGVCAGTERSSGVSP